MYSYYIRVTKRIITDEDILLLLVIFDMDAPVVKTLGITHLGSHGH